MASNSQNNQLCKGAPDKPGKKKSKKHMTSKTELELLKAIVEDEATYAVEQRQLKQEPQKKAEVSAQAATSSTKSKDQVSATPASTEQKPQLRLRLRATPNPSEVNEVPDFKLGAWKLRSSFRNLALTSITTVATEDKKYPPTQIKAKALLEKTLIDILKTSDPADHQQLEALNKELVLELHRCWAYFHHTSTTFEKHAKDSRFLTHQQLEDLEAELRSELSNMLEANKHEKDFLLNICQSVLTNILIAFKAHNAEIQQIEELLAIKYCESAFKWLTEKVTSQISGIQSAKDILRVCDTTSQTFFDNFEESTSEAHDPVARFHLNQLHERLKQHIQPLIDRNAKELEVFHKDTTDAFESCKSGFSLFARRSQFTSLADLKQEKEAALIGALQGINEVQLLPAGIIHVRQMLRNYAFDTMLQCAPDTPNAAEVLADKRLVTLVYGYTWGSPLQVFVEGLELEPISLDPQLWCKAGKFMVIDSRFPERFFDESIQKFEINPLVYFNFTLSDVELKRLRQTAEAAGLEGKPEQVIAIYFKELGKYLLEAHHIIPSNLTVIVGDFCTFLGKHRINSALQLAGLPAPKFMFHTGAVAAGYFDTNSISYAGSTLFLLARGFDVFAAVCNLTNTVKISSLTGKRAILIKTTAAFIVDLVQQNPDVQSLILVHNFSEKELEDLDLKSIVTSKVTLLRTLYATALEISALAVGGAAFVNKYSDAVYSERAPFELSYRYCNGPRKILARRGECLEQNVFDLDYLDVVSNTSLCLFVFENNREQSQFQLPSELKSEKLVCSMQLRKDGVLSKPEIRIKSSNQLVEWEMTGPLMPWNHQQFKEVQDLEIALWKLRDLESTPMKLKNVVYEQEETTRSCSGETAGASASNMGVSDGNDAAKEELRKLVGELLRVSVFSCVPLSIMKQAYLTMSEASELLEAEEVNHAKICLMTHRLKLSIKSLADLEID